TSPAAPSVSTAACRSGMASAPGSALPHMNSSCTDGMSVARRAIMARRHAVLLGVAALGLVAMTVVPSRAESVAARCPAYPAHLRTARDYLVRGNRAAAVHELRRAEDALGTCLRAEAAESGRGNVRTP